jgi:hypothetical protein
MQEFFLRSTSSSIIALFLLMIKDESSFISIFLDFSTKTSFVMIIYFTSLPLDYFFSRYYLSCLYSC